MTSSAWELLLDLVPARAMCLGTLFCSCISYLLNLLLRSQRLELQRSPDTKDTCSEHARLGNQNPSSFVTFAPALHECPGALSPTAAGPKQAAALFALLSSAHCENKRIVSRSSSNTTPLVTRSHTLLRTHLHAAAHQSQALPWPEKDPFVLHATLVTKLQIQIHHPSSSINLPMLSPYSSSISVLDAFSCAPKRFPSSNAWGNCLFKYHGLANHLDIWS